MASNPLFLLEDQTDEDFFDKLVDDDFSPSEQPTSSTATQLKFDDGSDSDDARAFANLSIVDDIVAHGDDTLKDPDPGNYAANGGVSSSPKNHDPLSIASESVQFVHSVAINLRDDGVTPKMDEMPQSETGKESNMIDGSESPGVKEVDWGSFCVDTSVRDGHGFGSYSDFFTELEGSAESLHGKDVAAGGILVSSDAKNISFGLNNSARSDQHQDEVHHDYASRQYVDNSKLFEDLYPGWKCDASTGQWYQVGGHDAISHESHGNSMKNWETAAPNNSDASYLEQSTKFTVGTVVEAGTVESVSSWNQAPQVGNGNPEHIVFDPRFPGWYYDTIAQNYYPLDSYNQASQATGQIYDQQAKNGYALTSNYSSSEDRVYDTYDKQPTLRTQEFGIQSHHGSWDQSYSSGNQQATKMWQSETVGRAEAGGTSTPLSSFRGNQQANSLYSTEAVAEHPNIAQTSQETSLEHFKPYQNGVQGFIPQHVNGASVPQNGPLNFSNNVYGNQEFVDDSQQSFLGSQLFSPTTGRSPDGRPPHALFSFGFGGKLIVMKDNNNLLHNSSFGSQGTGRNSFSVLNLSEVTSGSAHFSSLREDTLGYFRCLHQQSFPGPLVGGNVGSKELNKWLDERIVNCESSNMGSSRVKVLRLLLSLLKISCQYYGKLRSPFGTDTTQKEMDTAEAAVAKLFAFAKSNGIQSTSYAHINQCLQHLPPESQMQVTALEMQNLLVSGRKMEALQCAQEGRLWGPALVIAAQLGDQLYVDTVKQMALRQLVPGSPLRTLCLLIAGQPAEVFSSGITNDATFPGYLNVPQDQPHFESSSSLDNWEENLSIITANRTKDDELVITHLGDCLWKERSEIIPAHICYLMADMNFEPYSDTARLCLVGADHWKYPRTYASPEAIQRTELYEYSKTLGNSQYILLQFQPYKIIYAHMLAEVGKLSEALKYCQALLRCLKTGRSPEIETWKQFVISLEERIRAHQQRGYTVNSTPRKFVGKLLNFFDSTAQRVVGDMPPPAPQLTAGNIHLNEYNQQQEASKVPYSQSAFAIPSLMPSDSMKPSHEGVGDESRMKTQTRSVSEPDIARTPRQDQADSLKEKFLEEVTQVKSSETATNSRFRLFGFGILKKTVGRVLKVRSSKEAKLGDENQFYFDDKLKRWVERGVEPPAEEAALPPPPIIGAFQNNSLGSENGSENGSDLKNEMSPSSRSWSASSPTLSETSSVTPPISGGSNQFSARGHMGVRARYVDTFNQGRGNSQTTYRSPSGQYVKPPIPAKANFFIPTTPASPSNDQGVESVADSTQDENSADEASSAAPPPSHSFQTPMSSPMPMQRFPSADNMKRTGSGTSLKGELPPSDSRRAASWSGNLNGAFSPPSRVDAAGKLKPSPLSSCSSLAEELQDVEL